MNSQIRFAMHPDDEREFEQVLLSEDSVRLIEGPRWKDSAPITSRSLAGFTNDYCIIWSTSDIATLKAEYIPSCDDWYCRSEHATLQFLRSQKEGLILTEGRIAISTEESTDFPASRIAMLEARYKKLRKFIKTGYRNSILQWWCPSSSTAPAGPKRSANPSLPDPQVWVGPHALRWLLEDNQRCVKQFKMGGVQSVLIPDLQKTF